MSIRGTNGFCEELKYDKKLAAAFKKAVTEIARKEGFKVTQKEIGEAFLKNPGLEEIRARDW